MGHFEYNIIILLCQPIFGTFFIFFDILYCIFGTDMLYCTQMEVISMSERSKRILKSINNSDLSYGELSKLTGIPKSALQRYATGATEKIPIDRIEAIAKATGVQASYLLCWDSDNSYNEGAEEAALLKKYSQLNSSNKKAVLTLIENLLAAQS